jgi:hypothetical protein
MSYLPIGPKAKAFGVPMMPATDVYGDNPFPSAPTMTLYSPATTAYVKVTPAADTLLMTVAPTVTTETLTYASLITHKIADVTTITTAAPTTDETDRLRATEFKNDFNTHVASTAYHLAAGTAIATADATSDPTLIALCQALDARLKAHAASTTEHGGRGDAVFLAALVAAALPAVPSKAECRTWLADAVLKAAWEAHLAVTDNSTYMTTGAAVMPMRWPCVGPFWAKTNVSGHTFSTCEFGSA